MDRDALLILALLVLGALALILISRRKTVVYVVRDPETGRIEGIYEVSSFG